MRRTPLSLLITLIATTIGIPAVDAQDDSGGDDSKGTWIQLFNGEDLEGWTPKIRYQELGVNLHDTFRVEDGVLQVRYDRYDRFDEQFGHLFYKDSFSHYRLRVEYRFVGEQCPGGPGWALRNNGLM